MRDAAETPAPAAGAAAQETLVDMRVSAGLSVFVSDFLKLNLATVRYFKD